MSRPSKGAAFLFQGGGALAMPDGFFGRFALHERKDNFEQILLDSG